MPKKSNFAAEIPKPELETLRELSEALGYTLVAGQRAGEGSPRQLMRAIAQSTQRQGVARVAKALEYILAK